jgi:hypothetical protein
MVGIFLDLQLFDPVASAMAERWGCLGWDLREISVWGRLRCHDYWGLGNRSLRDLSHFRNDVAHSRYCSYLD